MPNAFESLRADKVRRMWGIPGTKYSTAGDQGKTYLTQNVDKQECFADIIRRQGCTRAVPQHRRNVEGLALRLAIVL